MRFTPKAWDPLKTEVEVKQKPGQKLGIASIAKHPTIERYNDRDDHFKILPDKPNQE